MITILKQLRKCLDFPLCQRDAKKCVDLVQSAFGNNSSVGVALHVLSMYLAFVWGTQVLLNASVSASLLFRNELCNSMAEPLKLCSFFSNGVFKMGKAFMKEGRC